MTRDTHELRPATEVLRSGYASSPELAIAYVSCADALGYEAGIAESYSGDLVPVVRDREGWRSVRLPGTNAPGSLTPIVPSRLAGVTVELGVPPPKPRAPVVPLLTALADYRRASE